MRRALSSCVAVFVAAALVVGCGEDAVETADPPAELSCLDSPNELPRPPAEGLPCELFPPSFTR